MASTTPFQDLTIDKHPHNVYVITLRRGAENKLTAPFCQEIIRAFHTIHKELGAVSEGAVITRGSNEKFWCTGLELEDPDPWASCDGFFPVCSSS
jgi:enoyl-CoA hydratase/carnithine racemase